MGTPQPQPQKSKLTCSKIGAWFQVALVQSHPGINYLIASGNLKKDDMAVISLPGVKVPL